MKKLMAATIMVALLAGVVWAKKKKLESYQSIGINAPAGKVWAVLTDPGNWAQDNPVVIEAELVEGDGASVGSVIKAKLAVAGKKPRPKLTVGISEKNRKIEYVVDMPLVEAVMGFTLEEKGGVTVLTNYEIASGPLLRAMTQEDMDNEHMDWVKAIKARLEPAYKPDYKGEYD